jgi:hypothetical protein
MILNSEIAVLMRRAFFAHDRVRSDPNKTFNRLRDKFGCLVRSVVDE